MTGSGTGTRPDMPTPPYRAGYPADENNAIVGASTLTLQ